MKLETLKSEIERGKGELTIFVRQAVTIFINNPKTLAMRICISVRL